MVGVDVKPLGLAVTLSHLPGVGRWVRSRVSSIGSGNWIVIFGLRVIPVEIPDSMGIQPQAIAVFQGF